MKFKHLSALAAIVGLSVGLSAQATQEKIQPRIIGGEDVVTAYSWMVSIQDRDGDHFCGGTLIEDNWVLTAAHCVDGVDAIDLQVEIGFIDLAGDPGDTRTVSGIFIYHDYNRVNADNDIALIKLSGTTTKEIAPLASLFETNNLPINAPMLTMGWGTTSTPNTNFPSVLQRVEIPLQTSTRCEAVYDHFDDDIHICAGPEAGGKDACQGDSGGPILTEIGGVLHHVGIVSYGKGCARAGNYGVYTKTANYADWIDNMTSPVSIAGDPNFDYVGTGMNLFRSFSVHNNSASTITINSVMIENNDDGNFSIPPNQCAGNLSPNNSCNITVRSTPTAAGFHSGAEIQVSYASSTSSLPLRVTGLDSLDVTDILTETNLNWYTGGDSPWSEHTEGQADPYLGSGNIGADQESVLVADVSGINDLYLYISVDSEAEFDGLTGYVDDIPLNLLSGELQWGRYLIDVAGAQRLTLIYSKDASVDQGADKAWIDDTPKANSNNDGGDDDDNSGGGGGGSIHWILIAALGLMALRRKQLS